ncbi:hypothetical protein VNI00_011592 [Paramarasmius palmivorus]|uniref:Uncharacterized protein n=1 Tax=Paramarasmius palmivorus TaxID=297713 RepID=A0AAW0CCQ6_9AGAR
MRIKQTVQLAPVPVVFMLRSRPLPTRSIRLGLRHASTISTTSPSPRPPPHTPTHNSVYIRFTPSFTSPNNTSLPTTLTLIHTLERLFGSITEFTLSAQDKHVTGNSLLVRFRDSESVGRVFSSGLVVSSNAKRDEGQEKGKERGKGKGKKYKDKTQVTLKLNFSPPVLPNRPGGVGLDDLNALGLLHKADYDPTFSPEGSGSGHDMTLTVESTEWPYETYLTPSSSTPKYISTRANSAFVRWHGFGPMSETMRAVVEAKVERIRKQNGDFVSPLEEVREVKEVQVEKVEVEPAYKVEAAPVPEPKLVPTTSAPEHEPTTAPQPEAVPEKSTTKPKAQVQEPEKEEIDPALGKAQINEASQLLESIRTQRDAEQMKKILAKERKRERAMKQKKKEKPLLEEEGSAGLEFAEMSEVKGKEEAKEEGKEGRVKKFLGGWF